MRRLPSPQPHLPPVRAANGFSWHRGPAASSLFVDAASAGKQPRTGIAPLAETHPGSHFLQMCVRPAEGVPAGLRYPRPANKALSPALGRTPLPVHSVKRAICFPAPARSDAGRPWPSAGFLSAVADHEGRGSASAPSIPASKRGLAARRRCETRACPVEDADECPSKDPWLSPVRRLHAGRHSSDKSRPSR